MSKGLGQKPQKITRKRDAKQDDPDQMDDIMGSEAGREGLQFGDFHSNGIRVQRLGEPSGCGGGWRISRFGLDPLELVLQVISKCAGE